MHPVIAAALREDLLDQGITADITSQLLIDPEVQAIMRFNAREDLIACGMFIPDMVFAQLKAIGVKVLTEFMDGDEVRSGQTLITVHGPAQILLASERVILNMMQRACSVATLTQRYVKLVLGTKAAILDTRKTMPGLRVLDKYAVEAGGGVNHRMGLYDTVLIKDNHIALSGNIAEAVMRARRGTRCDIIVECDTLAQMQEAMAAHPDRILLDNMSIDELTQAVEKAHGTIPLEASGGITLATVKAVAQTGVDFISVGALTHSAVNVDIGADVIIS